jgi:hypothetical protein
LNYAALPSRNPKVTPVSNCFPKPQGNMSDLPSKYSKYRQSGSSSTIGHQLLKHWT